MWSKYLTLSTDKSQQFTMTLIMTSAQVVETSVTAKLSSTTVYFRTTLNQTIILNLLMT